MLYHIKACRIIIKLKMNIGLILNWKLLLITRKVTIGAYGFISTV